MSRRDDGAPVFTYFIRRGDDGPIKIGRAKRAAKAPARPPRGRWIPKATEAEADGLARHVADWTIADAMRGISYSDRRPKKVTGTP